MFLPDEPDTDLETDRLLGQQRTDDQGFFDDKVVSTRPMSCHYTFQGLNIASSKFGGLPTNWHQWDKAVVGWLLRELSNLKKH
jgi:hypothetical protein